MSINNGTELLKAREQFQKLQRERDRLEAREDFDDDQRLVEIQDALHALMTDITDFRKARGF